MLVSFTAAGTALVTTFGLTAAAEIITYMWQTLRSPLDHSPEQLPGGASGSASGEIEGGGSEAGSGEGPGSGEASDAEGAGSGSGSASDWEGGPVEVVHRPARPHNRHVSFDSHFDEAP